MLSCYIVRTGPEINGSVNVHVAARHDAHCVPGGDPEARQRSCKPLIYFALRRWAGHCCVHHDVQCAFSASENDVASRSTSVERKPALVSALFHPASTRTLRSSRSATASSLQATRSAPDGLPLDAEAVCRGLQAKQGGRLADA